LDWPEGKEMKEVWDEIGTMVDVWVKGVVGPEEDGEAGSVIHKRWLLVATSLATVWANVLDGVT
jgi:hypothetical protein